MGAASIIRAMNRPTAIYSAAQVRALDACEIEKRRVPGFTLMTRAAEAALKLLRARWPQAQRVAVVCGAGNNGGDGYVLARLAQAAGLEALVLAATPPDKLDRRCAPRAGRMAGRRRPRASLRGRRALGQRRDRRRVVRHRASRPPPRPETLAVIRAINAAQRPVLALDIPSGRRCRQRRGARGRGARRDHAELRRLQVRTVPRRRAGTCGRGAARRSRRGGAGAAGVRAAHAAHRRGARSPPPCRAARASRTRARTAACWSSAAAPACRARCAWRARRRCASAPAW